MTFCLQKTPKSESKRTKRKLLKAEFANSPTKNTSVQTLKEAVERQVQRMIQQNPSRIDYYTRYQQVIQNYNRETDRVAIEQKFEELLKQFQLV